MRTSTPPTIQQTTTGIYEATDSAYLACGLGFLGLELRNIHNVVYRFFPELNYRQIFLKFTLFFRLHLFFTANALDNTVGWAGRAVLKSRTGKSTFSGWHLLGFNTLMSKIKSNYFNLIQYPLWPFIQSISMSTVWKALMWPVYLLTINIHIRTLLSMPLRGPQSIAWVRGFSGGHLSNQQHWSSSTSPPTNQWVNQMVNKITDVQSTNFSNIETNERLYCMRLKQ